MREPARRRRPDATSAAKRFADYFSLERNVGAASTAVLLLGMGEELWKKFLPKYLESLGASAAAIGLFGTAKDFLDAIYQYPGGWLSDRLGRRLAFFFFITLACVGYAIYLVSASWHVVFLGLVFAMAWSSMASPAIFAVIGDALPKHRRAMGFTLQSLLKRIPMAFAPLIGGFLIARTGILDGVRIALVITLVLAAATIPVVRAIDVPIAAGAPVDIRGVWRSFSRALKRLLVSDIVIRSCEGLAEVLIILYVINVIGAGVSQYGILVAIQMTTSMLVYLPAGRLADRVGRKPFVMATFACFALFPVAVAFSSSFFMLVIAFIIGGLREIGEPARKAMIVDLAEPHMRGRTVGLYYLARSLAITPAAALGGLLWAVAPRAPFIAAGLVGLIGVAVFAATVDEEQAA